MSNHKQAAKRNRQNIKINLRNRAARSDLRTAIKSVKNITDVDAAKKQLALTVKTIYKAAAKGLIHKRAAARKVSRLTRGVAKLAK